jgi:phage gpG-like protein
MVGPAPQQFRIVVYGAREVAEDFGELAKRVVHTRPAMEEIYLTMLDIEQEIFEKEGARGGDMKWAMLSPAWRARKIKMGGDPRILRFRGRLEASVTHYRHPDQFIRLDKDKIVFGSKLPYAKVHQKGSKHLGKTGRLVEGIGGVTVFLGEGTPQRKYVKFTNQDAKAFAKEVSRYVMKAFR